MRRRLAQPYPLPLSFVAPHTVMRGLGLLGIMFEVGRGVGVYVVAASGTAVSAPPSILSLHTLLYAGMH